MLDLDQLLCVQLNIAWAGEGRCEPARLGWWPTDLVDPAGGGDLFARLLPRTYKWAALEAVREAARRIDAQARKTMDALDQLRTLFHLGFELDEQLDERLGHHKRSGVAPCDALPELFDLDGPMNRDGLATWLRSRSGVGDVEHRVVPGGRQLKGTAPKSPELLAGRLAASLVPLSERYPMPFFRVTP